MFTFLLYLCQKMAYEVHCWWGGDISCLVQFLEQVLVVSVLICSFYYRYTKVSGKMRGKMRGKIRSHLFYICLRWNPFLKTTQSWHVDMLEAFAVSECLRWHLFFVRGPLLSPPLPVGIATHICGSCNSTCHHCCLGLPPRWDLTMLLLEMETSSSMM